MIRFAANQSCCAYSLPTPRNADGCAVPLPKEYPSPALAAPLFKEYRPAHAQESERGRWGIPLTVMLSKAQLTIAGEGSEVKQVADKREQTQ